MPKPSAVACSDCSLATSSSLCRSSSRSPASTSLPDSKWILSTMPASCSARSAPFTPRKVPTAVSFGCHCEVVAVVVDTVWGGSASAASAFLIRPARKLTNQARPANTTPTIPSMIIIRFNMVFSRPPKAASVDGRGGPRRQRPGRHENPGDPRRLGFGRGRFIHPIPPAAAERLIKCNGVRIARSLRLHPVDLRGEQGLLGIDDVQKRSRAGLELRLRELEAFGGGVLRLDLGLQQRGVELTRPQRIRDILERGDYGVAILGTGLLQRRDFRFLGVE